MRLLLTLSALAVATAASAQTITLWDFNASNTTPTTGTGTFAVTGGTTNPGYNAGFSGVAGDVAFQTTTYPAQSTNSGTAGVRGATSTAGYTGIGVTWNHRHSNTSANTIGFEYTLDGSTFSSAGLANGGVFTFTPAPTGTGDTWYTRSVDLSGIAGASDNANFGFRIVALFAPTTTNYVASRSTSSYGPTSTWRFDNVRVTGTVVPEPASMAVLGLGLAALKRRRRSSK